MLKQFCSFRFSGKHVPVGEADSLFLKNWLSGWPTVPSHYCRKVPSYKEKKFLYPGTTKSNLYREYRKSAEKAGVRVIGETFFNKVFEKEKLSVFTPRKDQCDLCVSAKHGNTDQDALEVHIKAKNEARAEKASDKEKSSDKMSVWTVDVQAVLICPKTQASAMYYKTKLQVHNFTCFNLGNKDGYCYTWEEHEGDLSAEVFAHIQFQHFAKLLDANPTIEKIVVWSDGCGYQNRNAVLSNAYLHLANQYNIVIEQKFLVVGHTQMECDSMHSTIERKVVGDIYTPRDYHVIFGNARIRPSPYHVTPLSYKDFLKLPGNYLNSIRPGKKAGDPTVFNLRALQYTPDGKINYKLDFGSESEWQNLPQRITIPAKPFKWIRLFKAQLPISFRKFNDLQSMKHVLPQHAHHYFDTLPHLNA